MELTTEQKHSIQAGRAVMAALRTMLLEIDCPGDDYDRVEEVADNLVTAHDSLGALL